MPDPALAGYDALLGRGILLVTGKGGTGKTTTAAALALAGVASGRRTLLVEVEDRQGLHRAFGTGPWDHTEREFRPGLWGAALDPGDAVHEYLEMFYGIKRVQWLMERSNALDFVTTAAPGLRDLLLVGKLYEIETRRGDDGRRVYDLIVVDAPPTGRIAPFLAAPEGVTEIVRAGPIKRQAGQIRTMLRDPARVRAVLVSLLEEMPVQETVEGVAALTAAGIEVGAVVANQVVAPHLGADDAARLAALGVDGLRERAAAAGAPLSGPAAATTLAAARDHRRRLALQTELRRDLAVRTARPVLALPTLTGSSVAAPELEVLADVLAVQVGEHGPRAADLVAGLAGDPNATRATDARDEDPDPEPDDVPGAGGGS